MMLETYKHQDGKTLGSEKVGKLVVRKEKVLVIS
jgi:hypothetical protein